MALDCHRVWRETVLAVMLTKARDVFAAHGLFTSLRRRGVRYVITDGVSWYRLATRWTRLRHSVVHGGMRSHVERFIETIKDRLKGLRLLFPIHRRGLMLAEYDISSTVRKNSSLVKPWLKM